MSFPEMILDPIVSKNIIVRVLRSRHIVTNTNKLAPFQLSYFVIHTVQTDVRMDRPTDHAMIEVSQ